MNRHRVAIGIAAVVVLVVALIAVFGLPFDLFFQPTETAAGSGLAAEAVEHETIAENLEVPWEVVVLGEDRYLVTERTGDLLLLSDGERHVLRSFDDLEEPVLGEGGRLGIAVHPDFEANGYRYVYQTVDREGVENTARRFEVDLENRELSNETVIIDGIPSDRFHNGGRIAFGPDGHLYLTTSNTDGRGTAGPDDDRLIRVPVDAFRAD